MGFLSLTAESRPRPCDFGMVFWLSSYLSGCSSLVSICGCLHCAVPKTWGPWVSVLGLPLFSVSHTSSGVSFLPVASHHVLVASATRPDPQTPASHPRAQGPARSAPRGCPLPGLPAQPAGPRALGWPRRFSSRSSPLGSSHAVVVRRDLAASRFTPVRTAAVTTQK